MDKDYRALLCALDPFDLAMVDTLPTPLFSNYLTVMEDFLETESRRCLSNEHFSSMILGEFANILRKSFFVNLYTSLETYLVGMCKGCEFPRKTDKIKKAVYFLVKDESVRSLLYQSSAWKEIGHYRILRNCIVHDEGKLTHYTRERTKLEQYIASKRPLLRLSYNNILMSRDFCEEALDVVDTFSIAVLVESRGFTGINRPQ